MARGKRTPGRADRQRSERRILPPQISEGHEALARGDWNRARTSFEESLRVAETPEGLEGLGMAAWWLEDAATVFAARGRAYRLYRRQGNRRGAGRVAITVAEDYLQFRGEAAVASGWHHRARRLLDGLDPVPEHGWLKLWEGDLAITAGSDPARASALARDASAIGRDLSDVDLEMTALALEGLSRVLGGELAQGMPRLDEATTAAMSGEMSDPLAIGLSCCYLVTACERIRDFERAAQWCRRVQEFCERTGFGFLLSVCRMQYAGVLAWRGRWAEAEHELQSVALHAASTRPAVQQEAIVRLADLRRQQGRLDEASLLLNQVDPGHPLAMLARASVALDRGEPASAARQAQRFLRQTLNRTDRVAALEVQLRAQLALGQRSEARATLDELQAIAATVATEPVRASALIGQGLAAAYDGEHDRARGALEDASDLLARSGASLELARCRVELARVLAAAGEREGARTELQEALRTFEALGAGPHAAATSALLGVRGGASARREPGAARLTRREVEVLRLVAQGLSNQQIATRLVVSEFTVKRHVANLLAKLDLRSRAAAAAYAAGHGLT